MLKENKEIPEHQMTLLCSDHPTGSPLQFYVDYVNSGHVTAYGSGLIHGTVNKPAVFTVNTKDAGEGSEALDDANFDEPVLFGSVWLTGFVIFFRRSLSCHRGAFKSRHQLCRQSRWYLHSILPTRLAW